jgi:hypothetical protein
MTTKPQPSHLEALAMRLMAAEGLPPPVPEHRFAAPRRWRFDFAWPAHMVALELEGGIWSGGRHVRPAGFEADCEKYSVAALHGWCVVRVTASQLMDGRAMAWLKVALARG